MFSKDTHSVEDEKKWICSSMQLRKRCRKRVLRFMQSVVSRETLKKGKGEKRNSDQAEKERKEEY